MEQIVDARPVDLDLVLVWSSDEHGGLTGELRARNVSDGPVRLGGKPGLQVLGVDGKPLDVRCILTAEIRRPGYVDLYPGEEAVSPVLWAGWDGGSVSGEVVVRLPGGSSRVRCSGPRQPTAVGPAMNLSASWWKRTDGSDA